MELQLIEPLVTIYPWSLEAIGSDLTGQGLYLSSTVSAAFQIDHAAFLVPFTLNKSITIIRGFWYNGSAVGYNVDVGVFDISGNLLCHTGNVVSANINTVQNAAIASTRFGPGNFYLAVSTSSISQTFFSAAAASSYMLAVFGIAAILSGENPLVTGTPVSIAGSSFGKIPVFGVSTRTVI
jgi:hypothetical protein